MNLIRNKFTRNIKGFVLLALNYFSGGGLPILMYHSVSYNKIFFTVTPESFQKQMEWLHRNKCRVIRLKELADIIGRKGEIPKKTAVLTFDDSFEDIYFNAWPVLKKYGFPAAVFTVTDFIGKEQRNESTGILFKTLRWEQIKEMHDSGLIDFEPHTCGHRELTKISPEEARKEILDSRRIIEEGLNKKCHFFAYPRGKYNQDIVNILKENNFLAALTVNPGRAGKSSNLLELPRQSIDSATGRIQFMYKVR